MRRAPNQGFTLVELMVTVAIVAILLAVALPSFEGSMRSNRVATASNELIASIALARSEAIRSPRGAAICTTTDGEQCDGDWNDGWMVWIDAEGDGVETGADDRVVRYTQARNKVEVVADVAVDPEEATTIRFDRRGRTIGSLRSLTIEPDECPEGNPLRRVLTVSTTGQTHIVQEACEA